MTIVKTYDSVILDLTSDIKSFKDFKKNSENYESLKLTRSQEINLSDMYLVDISNDYRNDSLIINGVAYSKLKNSKEDQQNFPTMYYVHEVGDTKYLFIRFDYALNELLKSLIKVTYDENNKPESWDYSNLTEENVGKIEVKLNKDVDEFSISGPGELIVNKYYQTDTLVVTDSSGNRIHGDGNICDSRFFIEGSVKVNNFGIGDLILKD